MNSISDYKYTLSICAIFHNEAPYLKEWIEYHKKVGVEHFWLYNNNSRDNYQQILKSFIKDGVVELIEWPSEEKEGNHFFYQVQSPAYTDALSKAKGISKWLAIIDIDEFIVPIQENKVSDCLENSYSGFPGVCVNWQYFGTSHVPKCKKVNDSIFLLNDLTLKMKWDHPLNQHFKSIVQPKYVLGCPNPHFCHYIPPHYPVTTDYIPVGHTHLCPININILQLNHYWPRDEWYLNHIKIPRQLKWGTYTKEAALEHVSRMNEERDEKILKYL